jgi:hypothetical protein
MRTILAALFAIMIGVVFAGSTFAAEQKMAAPATTKVATGEMKKEEGKKDVKAAKKHHTRRHAAKKEEKK